MASQICVHPRTHEKKKKTYNKKEGRFCEKKMMKKRRKKRCETQANRPEKGGKNTVTVTSKNCAKRKGAHLRALYALNV